MKELFRYRFATHLLLLLSYGILGTALTAFAGPTWELNPIVATAKSNEAFELSLAPYVVNPDNEPIAFSKESGPSWLVVTAAGLIAGTPSRSDVGVSSTVVRVVSMAGVGDQGSATTVQVTVDANNEPPPPLPTCTLTATPNTVFLGQSITLSLVTHDVVDYASINGHSCNIQSCQLEVTPPSAGDFSVVGMVRGAAGSANCYTYYTVSQAPPPNWKQDPVLLPDAKVGVPYTADLTQYVTDPAGRALALSIEWSDAVGPNWLTLNPGGQLTGTPSLSNVGSNSVLVRATDEQGATSNATVMINVK